MANRYKRVLGAMISPAQSAFILNRAITDNIIIGHECLHHIRNQKTGSSGLAALKLDLSKAFDRVEWTYIERLMLKFGFARDWVNLIMRCISSTRISIILNGSPTGSMITTRDANATGRLHSLSFAPSGPLVSHLLFANDSLIFFRANELQFLALKDLLSVYGTTSDQCINFAKSALIFSPNVHILRQQFLPSLLDVVLVNDFGNYFGLPSSFSRRKGQDWRFLKDRIWRVMQDLGATDHVAKDRGVYVEFRRIPSGASWLYVGNNARVPVKGIGS
ncbi:uncharacterized protein LOC111013370 [Momordica charantia]|uniref:Uncharacterized protein LOC111013370 n=1 Tax=Momordica charantia TaxID=3673 RepID=A0A6J1CQU9_MOMCH|nr:uncharacterized protein LOC111013370 [Momordica charantia]